MFGEKRAGVPAFALPETWGGHIIKQELRINGEIRAREIRVVGPSSDQLGVMPLREGIRLAEEADMDLVEVAPLAKPPVCRVMNYGKFKYEQSKREKDARKKQKISEVKELRMSPKIDDHDFGVRVRNAEKFLKEGDKVKIAVRFRGREIVHSNLARELLQDLATRVSEVGSIERPPRVEGRQMIMILSPRPQD